MFLAGYATGVLSSCFLVVFAYVLLRILIKKPDESIIPLRFNPTRKGKKAPLIQDDEKAYRKEQESGNAKGSD